MSSSYGHHAAGGPSPGAHASFHPGAYSNISPLAPLSQSTQVPSQLMGSSHSKSTNPGPQASSSAFKAAVSGGIGFKRVFAYKRKKSLDMSARSAEHDLPRPLSSAVDTSPETLNINVKKSHVRHIEPLSSSPPPLPPKHSPYPPTLVQPKSLNRQSILPISPGISPAVNYMLQQQEQTDDIKTPISQPQPQPQPQPQQSASAPKETEKIKQHTPDNVGMKESWRKSDSTNSHTTVRPGGNGGSSTRTSRPVSVAESFQSTHTVVQTSGKRLSALVIDDMAEEDVESSTGDNSSSHPSKSIPPPSSDRVKNRRSLSLNLGPSTNKTLISPPLGSASASEFKHSLSPPTMLNTSPAQSSPTRLSLAPPPSTSVDTNVGHQQPQQPRTSGVNNFRGKFAAWANSNLSSDSLSRQDRTLPVMPSQERRPSLPHFSPDGDLPSPPTSMPTPLRQTTTSMTGNGLGSVIRAVEKIGWKWGMSLTPSTSGSGSGYSSSSSSANVPSSRTSDLVRTNSNRSTPSVHSHIVKSSQSHGSAVGLAGVGGKRTPDAPSGAYSIHSVASKSDQDPFSPSLGPSLGTMLRGGQRNKNGGVSSGVVFGRSLRTVTRETGVNVGKEMGSMSVGGGRVKEGLILELERRLLPAIVVRCAQHLLIWGVQEEGLFRLSGRPSHVSKLRSEFDSGVDYDMTECSPGDLDPHAVASVFKAYLRELPESILTHTLSPLFDAAIKREVSTNLNSIEANRSSAVGRGNNGKSGLPQGPKSGLTVRKPPSLSTLSMPTFSGIPPPSTSLVAEVKSLVSKLPQENYDLLRTVVDLVKATGKESTKTKMPLSNLMLVFCPSLNMAPPLLKVFCEAEDIWAKVTGSPPPPPLPSKDGPYIKREEEADVTNSSEEMEEDEVEGKSLMSSGRASLDTTDDPSSGYHASAEEEASLFEDGQVLRRRHLPERKTERSEIPTIYLDTMSHYSSSSGSSLREFLEPSGHHHYHRMDSKDADDDDESISPASGLIPPALSPSTPLCSSSTESVAHPISESSASLSQLQEGGGMIDGLGPVEIVDPDSIPTSLAPMTPTKTASIGHPSPTNDDNALCPQQLTTPSVRQKRMSISLLSLPNCSPSFIASSGNADRLKDDDSPCPSPTSPSSGVHMLNKRSKRPSLRLLFSKSKKSGSSLNSLGDRSGNGISVISNPIQQHLPRSPAWDSGTSDSSGSTPLSAVTAASGTSSYSHLPPVLDTPIDGSPLSLDMGFAGSPPNTAIPDRGMREQQKLAKVDVDVTSPSPAVAPAISESARLDEVQTPIASRLSGVPPSPITMIPTISYPSLDESLGSSPSLSVSERPSLSLRTRSSDAGLSISSKHSPQLSLLDNGVEEDWTQSVLSAADKL